MKKLNSTLKQVISYIVNRLFVLATDYLPYKLMLVVDFIVYIKKIINPIKPISENFCINIEWIKEANIDYNWWNENKPLWISWICRIKNWDDFLEQTIESHLVLCDEIIIWDNLSTDKTKEISLKLQGKYPWRVIYFEYPYEVYPIWSNEFLNCPANSLHSFAYQSNWTMSKSKYKYIIKVDDDNIIVPDLWKNLRNKILSNPKNRYYYYYWINLLQKKSIIWVPKQLPYSWKYADHWIFPISKFTYFDQFLNAEMLYHPYLYCRFWELFLHLKFLKKDFWCWNREENLKNNLIKQVKKYELDTNIKKYSKYFTTISEVKLLLETLKIKNKAE